MAKFREENSKRIKENIVKTAAKLFAKHSYSDVGLRKIAKEANSTLNTVTYHFGSKKKLFDETMNYVFKSNERFKFLLEELEEIDSLPLLEVSRVFYKITDFAVFSLVGKTVYRLRSRLVDRMLVDENPAVFQFVDSSFMNLNNNFCRILCNSGIRMSVKEYRLWAMGFWSEVQFLSYGKQLVLDVFQERKYTDELLRIMVDSIVRKNLRVLQLPELEELQEN